MLVDFTTVEAKRNLAKDNLKKKTEKLRITVTQKRGNSNDRYHSPANLGNKSAKNLN